MKIKQVELGRIAVPLKMPFKTALRTVHQIDDIAVRVVAEDGTTGYGEAPPTAVITGDTKESIAAAISGFIAPAIVGRDVEDLDGTVAAMEKAIVGNHSAKAAVDMALYDLFAKRCGLPLYKLLGGSINTVETDMTVSVNDAETMARDAQKAVADGFGILKVKVGKGGLADVALVAAVRKAVGPGIAIRVDANQGWQAKQAVRIIRAMEDAGLDIELVEQPVPAADLAGMRYVTQNVGTAILADESVFSARDAVEIIKTGAADLINIKLMKAGGIHSALRICAVAESYGVECMLGCMLESRLAVGAAAHLAAAKGIITRADLDGPAYCDGDPYEGGPVLENGRLTLPDTPGIGFTNIPVF